MGKVPKNIELWKYVWDMLMNDTRLRKALTGNAAEHEVNVCMPRNNVIQSQRGTVYISDPKADNTQGHFIAFKVNNSNVVVFDPAPPEGTYGAWANAQVIHELEKRMKRKVRISKHHTQHHEEDSFCQTWTLAWLIPSLHNLTKNVKNGRMGIERMYEIVQKIMHSRIFREFVKKHARTIQRDIILPGIREFKVKRPEFIDVEGFISFIDKRKFRLIFED